MTICIVKANNSVFGMFTDVTWFNRQRTSSGDGNSFVFSFDKDQIIIFKHKGGGRDETWHADHEIFAMGFGGPYAK